MKTLQNVMQLNAISCLGFAALFIFAPSLVSSFLGEVPTIAVQIIGGGLLLNAIHLVFASQRSNISLQTVIYFAAGDILWFMATLFVLASGAFITTSAGIYAALAVAIVVATIGLAQIWTFAQVTASGDPSQSDEPNEWLLPSDLSRIGAIGPSWLGMKTWVKLWLFALNGVFLTVLIWWPSPLAKYTMAAFVASGPLLFAFMFKQRGLTRLLGIAHLVPWLPLLAYLALRLSSEVAGPQITMSDNPTLFGYACLLSTVIAICLAFDVYDVARWISGARGRLGSPSEIHSKT